jgi:hypothetical protein
MGRDALKCLYQIHLPDELKDANVVFENRKLFVKDKKGQTFQLGFVLLENT